MTKKNSTLLSAHSLEQKYDNINFQEVAEHLYDGIYITDGHGKTLYVNKAYTRITGIQAHEVVGYNVEQLMKKGIFINAVTPEVIQQRKQVNSIAHIPRTNKFMLVTGTPIFANDGSVKAVVVIDREYEDLQGMQQELEMSRKRIKVVEKRNAKTKLEVEYLRQQQMNANLIGQSDEIFRIKQQILQIASFDVTVLIEGETGVGKEVIANEIHRLSKRNNYPLIKVNCAAIPSDLLEAELFGYEKGAFTGAAQNGKIGLFELADKGTLFLDEIGDMPLSLQVKLLRILQHNEYYRIGAVKPTSLDVRVITATNVGLKNRVQKGDFREDLFYRINVFPINIPPLRKRIDDIEVLTEHFTEHFNQKYHKHVYLSKEALTYLKNYSWPGNVRELSNIIERLVIIAKVNHYIEPELISSLLGIEPYKINTNSDIGSLKATLAKIERQIIEDTLKKYGSTYKAAKVLGINQSTIVKKRQSWQCSCVEIEKEI